MGIETDCDIDYGRIFGPFPEVGQISKSYFIGLLTTDDKEENQNVKINIECAGLSVTWLPYVRAARTEDEQNMEAYTKNGHIYYRTLRIIKAGEELLVWYSKDFSQILGIPSFKKQVNQEGHTCEVCGTKFRYLYPLLAHIKFRCTGICASSSQASPKRDTEKIEIKDNVERLYQNKSVSPSYKRNSDTDECSVPAKRLFDDKVMEINNNENQTSVNCTSKFIKSGSAESEEQETWSAFRKVEKSSSSEVRNNCETSTATSFIETTKHRQRLHDNIGTKFENGLNKLMNHKSYFPVGTDKIVSQSLGMLMSSGWMVPGSFPGQPYLDPRTLNNKLVNIAADKIATNTIREASDVVAGQYQNKDLNKQMLLDDLQNVHFSYFKPANPMVDKMMHSSASSAMLQRPIRALGVSAQNWCAKCNASFRMTSDLVYHMRSHHKREFDPMKRKREEKLQCNVCQETFKERHHLTRHMTSHM